MHFDSLRFGYRYSYEVISDLIQHNTSTIYASLVLWSPGENYARLFGC